MDWRSGLVLLVVLSLSLLTSAALVPHQDGPGVSVTFVETDTVDIASSGVAHAEVVDSPSPLRGGQGGGVRH